MKIEYTVACLFGGIGGGALGFNGARAEYMGKVAKFRSICSIDSDPVVCRNYEIITGGKAVCMDLFDRQQYTDFHGKEPSDAWREAEPWDIWQAFGEQIPDVIFTSPPCKGFSGLLPEKSASSKKYQALNLLTIRGIEISLAACRDYGGELPALFLLENVPRIMTRGKHILTKIKSMLIKYGYVVNDESHDCGEIGGLGQHRKRYLLIARNVKRMSAFVYKPEIKALQTIGDVIGPLPLPGDEVNGGPMNRIQNLQRKTWERLAFIPAGGDWRDLEGVEFEKYRLEHEPRGAGAFGVQDWNETGKTVIGNAKINGSNGCAAVADPRINHVPQGGAYEVADWADTSRTVTGGQGVGKSNGVSSVADPRTGFKKGTHASIYRVSEYEEPSPTVTGAARPNNGALSVGDPRLKNRDSRHAGVYRVVRMDEPSPCVTGTRFGSGALAIADPRLHENSPKFNHAYKISEWDETAGTVAGSAGPSNGALVVADPRTPNDHYEGDYNRVGGYGVQNWDETAKTVRGAGRIMNSPSSIADPRVSDRDGERRSNGFPVRSWEGQAYTVTGEDTIGSGAQSVADPRVSKLKGRFPNKWQVQEWDEVAATVIGSTDIQSGAPSINDPRLGCAPRSGSYGVQGWNIAANTVTESGDVHSGNTAVADPRIPEQNERCVMIIIAEDGTWHRPFTTFELAVGLQGFPQYLPDGRPFQLEGCSDAKAREYIGNAVPPDAAKAIANVIIMAMVMSEAGESFILTHQEVWVIPDDILEKQLVH